MALPAIIPSDFIGDIRLSQNTFRTDELINYISFYYPQLIQELIGDAALQEIEDTAILPAKYVDILQGSGTYFNLCEEKDLQKPQLVEIAKRIIYFQWVRDYSINTTAGDVRNISENATELNNWQLQSNARQRFNWAIKKFNDEVLPFLRNYKDYQSTITLITPLGGGVLQISTPDTIYLQDGDSVTIGGEDFTISNLVDDVSFDITASFTDNPTTYNYSPFEILTYEVQNPALF